MPKMQPISHVSPEFQAFLDSDLWQHARQAALERDNHRCVLCGSQESLQVHHTSYRAWWNPDGQYLMTLCDSCHRIITKYLKMCKIIASKSYVNKFDAIYFQVDAEELEEIGSVAYTPEEIQSMANVYHNFNNSIYYCD